MTPTMKKRLGWYSPAVKKLMKDAKFDHAVSKVLRQWGVDVGGQCRVTESRGRAVAYCLCERGHAGKHEYAR